MGYKKGAEIGVAEGKFSEVLCEAMPGLELLCVDPWERYPQNQRGGGSEKQHNNLQDAIDRLSKYNTKLVRQMSMEAVIDVPWDSLDFVYIDGNHNFDYVMQDIIEWSKCVRSGGVVSGHDYYHFNQSGVIEAVDAYIKAHGIRQWWITQEREPTWYWRKP